ncbi:MAG: sigma-70 family RNA polymerase sigma factor, partial [Sedimentisphaerales bacterium]|nr:sigma-70 family RNA polymerase sigma factor [Sedimentisphaerales bacterium]
MPPRIVSILRQAFLPSDEQAMLSVRRQADPAAFALLMRRWQQPIQRLCRRMTGDAHLAEDLTQEVFSRLYTRRLAYRGEGKFSNYIWRIAVNVCTDRHRRRRPGELTGLDGPDELDGA